MKSTQPRRIHSVKEYHHLMSLPNPAHPLISVIKFEDMKRKFTSKPINMICDFYSIALKRNANTRMKYGQQDYDFDEGLMTFMAPGQVFRIEVKGDEELTHAGLLLLVHPDFLWNTPLIKTIKQYAYFGYSVNEALCLSDSEEATVKAIIEQIDRENRSAVDRFSHSLILAQIELLLINAERFYHRQFITRRIMNHEILDRVAHILTDYFNSDALIDQGLPTVQAIADALHVSPNYLSGVLRALTGQSTQQHIHEKLIEKAKEHLSTTSLSVSEIAYALGFEHSQSFSKLFKSKTTLSPLAFRQSFN